VIQINVKDLDKVKRELAELSSGRLRQAVATTLNQVAGRVGRSMRQEMVRAFDRPTPYTLRSVRVDPASTDRLAVSVRPTYLGGKGVDPQQFLRAQAQGGMRKLKRSERALQRVGVLPAGYYTAIPKLPFPGSDDGRGNLRGPFLVQLLSYFQAFGEQGYRANMTDKRKARLANRGLSAAGYKQIGGVEYFASYGRLRTSARGQASPLAPGIWAKSGTGGAVVRPVLMFVRAPRYSVRLDLAKVARQTNPSALFSRWLRGNIRDQYRAQVALPGEAA
jgi:hypothetical protein